MTTFSLQLACAAGRTTLITSCILCSAAMLHAADHDGHQHDHTPHHDQHQPHDDVPIAAVWSQEVGSTTVRLIDITAITQIAFGITDATEERLQWSQVGAHDPQRDGFNFQQLELGLVGAIHPYVRGEVHTVLTDDDGIELEEAFVVTTDLPHGLEVEAGLMLSEFGHYNPQHGHAYAHIDMPLIIGTFLGSEGLRDIGVRFGAQLPTSWDSMVHLSLQNGDNDTAISFLGEGHSHDDEEDESHSAHSGERDIDSADDLLWSARWANNFEIGEDHHLAVGLSGMYGPNQLDDHTVLVGADVAYAWHAAPAMNGTGTLRWVNEVILRDVSAGHEEEHAEEEHAAEDASDWGFVSTLTYDLTTHWQLGMRVDYVDLDHAEEGPEQRWRLSPLVAWKPWPATIIRSQYNYTEPDSGMAVHSVWLGLQVELGAGHDHNH